MYIQLNIETYMMTGTELSLRLANRMPGLTTYVEESPMNNYNPICKENGTMSCSSYMATLI